MQKSKLMKVKLSLAVMVIISLLGKRGFTGPLCGILDQ